jgi:hypothetical protein
VYGLSLTIASYAAWPSLAITSLPFTTATDAYVWAKLSSGVQSLDVLVNSANAIVGIAGANGEAAPGDGYNYATSHPAGDGNGNFLVGSATISQITATATVPNIAGQSGVVRQLAFGQQSLYGQAIGGVGYLGSAAPKIYDGATLTEWGFYQYPVITATAGAAGSGSLTGGSYEITACYRWTDAAGNVWRSPTAFTVPVTNVPATGSITISATPLALTAKQNVVTEVYATVNVGGQTGVSFVLIGTGNTITMAAADSTYASNQALYTNGGVPDNSTPPPFLHLSSSGLRLYGTCGDDGQVYASSPAIAGQPLNFPLSQSVVVPGARANLIGAQPQDGLLWLAATDAWYFTNADSGSLVQAGGNIIAFNPPARAAFASGCLSARSLFPSGQGIYFQGSRGIELLTRQQQIQFIGEMVKNATAGVNILGAYIVPGQQQLRFVLPGLTLCYDYERGAWLQHAYPRFATIAAACAYNGAGLLATVDGLVRVEGTGFYDDSFPVTMRIQTPWLRVGGIEGWGKAWNVILLGEQENPCNVQLQIAYNNDPVWIDTLTIPATTQAGTAFGSGILGPFGRPAQFGPPQPFGQNPAGNAFYWEGILPRADENAYKFEITTQNTGGEDVRLNILSLIYGVAPAGRAQFPTAKKFG